MINILNIETATTNCSVSLSQDGETLVLKEDRGQDYSHAEILHLYIKEVMQESGLTFRDLHAISVSKGPGSYTGLRIGVSAAKGLCFALNIPLIAVPTLESLAHQVEIDKGFIVPMLDARRMEVYSAVFDETHTLVRSTQAEILSGNSFESFLVQDKVYFIGNGVEKSKSIINHDNVVFMDNAQPSARELGRISFQKYKKNDIEDVAYFEPFYLKDFIALKPKS